MEGMFPYFRVKLPLFIDLETRSWTRTLEVEPIQGAPPETQTLVYWARAIAAGHLHRAAEAHRDLAAYDALIAQVLKGRHAYAARARANGSRGASSSPGPPSRTANWMRR